MIHIPAQFKKLFEEASSTSSPETSLADISAFFQDSLQVDTVAFALWDNVSAHYICQFVFGPASESLMKPEPWMIPNLPVFADFNNCTPIFLNSSQLTQAGTKLQRPALQNVTSYTVLPLPISGQPMGLCIMLSNVSPNPDLFIPEELTLLQFFSASRLENLRLENASRQKSANLSTLYEIYKKSGGSTIRPDNVLGSLPEAVKALISYDVCILYGYNSNNNTLHANYTHGEFSQSELFIKNPEKTEIQEVLTTKEPLLFHLGSLKSCMCIPINHNNKLQAILFLGTGKTFAYHRSDLITIGVLASHFAAIDHMLQVLIQMKNYSNSFLDAMKDGLLVIDNDGLVTHLNQAAHRFLQIDDSQTDQHFRKVLDKRQDLLKLAENAALTGKQIDAQEISSPIEEQILTASSFPFLNNEGIRLGFALHIRDITEDREMEAMIRRSDRLIAMGEMAASIAHEIRNPLTGIKMLAQNVMDELTEPNSEIVNLATMQINEVKRLDRIITEMLQFARPSEPSIKQQNLHEIIDSVLYLLEEKAKEMGIKFCKYYQARQQVSCDEAQFKQLLFNILINAMDASPQQGEITVTTKNNQSQTQIFIKDNGSGIPDAILGKIFNPFFTTKEKGTGLGLSIAHRIMTEHGGTISYVSSKDKGTTATITLEEN